MIVVISIGIIIAMRTMSWSDYSVNQWIDFTKILLRFQKGTVNLFMLIESIWIIIPNF